mgnify:CR=1 FL=1
MKILITGVYGIIGSYLCEKLRNEGFFIVGIGKKESYNGCNKYYYCDIIETAYLKAENAYIFTDLLADVIIHPDGAVEVVDLGELSDALEDGSITEREIKLALRNLDSLLQVIYSGGLPEMIHFMEKKV